jgi:hypothetical protein
MPHKADQSFTVGVLEREDCYEDRVILPDTQEHIL